MSMKLIRQAAITRLAALFPTYKEIVNVFNIEDNPTLLLNSAYGAIWGDATQADSQTRRLAYNSALKVYLTYKNITRESDKMASHIDAYYDDVDVVLKSFFDQTMLGLPNTIRGLKQSSVASPQLIAGKQIVLFEIEMIVDYTIPINII